MRVMAIDYKDRNGKKNCEMTETNLNGKSSQIKSRKTKDEK